MGKIKITPGSILVLAGRQRTDDEAGVLEIVDVLIEQVQTVGHFTGAQGLRVFGGPTDPISDMPVFILAKHHHLHEGEMHQVTYPPAALANNASIDFRLVIGNLIPTTRTPHITIELDTTGESWLYLYETPTTTANGTQLTAINKNRNQTAIAPNMTVWQAPTVTAVGTMLSAWISGSGEKSGGQSRESVEWDLAPNKVYLVRVTAKNANNVCLRFIWYEDLGV
ncbi:MAG: hypothetical protein IPI97_14840 [Nitrosomonas sp.]|nr:hypothetical protein [Nitrosomonas sp.]